MIAKMCWASVFLFIDFLITPSLNLMIVVVLAMTFDFATGIVKAKFKKEARTSEGYRKTIVKFMQYIVPIVVLYAASKMIPEHANWLKSLSGYLMMFIIYIEVSSIFENLYDIDSASSIAKYFYRPALMILKFGIEKNPVTTAAEKLKEGDKEDKSTTL